MRDPLRMRKLSVGRHTAGCLLLAIYVFEGLRLAFQPFLLGLDVHRVPVVLELGVDIFGAPLADFVSHDILTAASEELLHCICSYDSAPYNPVARQEARRDSQARGTSRHSGSRYEA